MAPARWLVRTSFSLGLILATGSAFGQAGRPTRSSAIAVTPDGSRVWVVNPDSNSVTVLETAGDTVVGEIPAGGSPRTLAIGPDGGRVYVANLESNDLSVIDTSTLSEIARVPIGAQPYGVAVTPDGGRLYVTNSARQRVTVLSTATLAVLAQIPTPPRPRGVAVSADGSQIVVTHFLTPVPALSGTVTLIDGASNAVVAGVPVALLPGLPGVADIIEQAVIRPGTSLAWIPMVQLETGNPNPQLTTTVHPAFAVVDITARAEVAALRTSLDRTLSRVVSQPTAVDFSPDGAVALIVNMASDDLVLMRAATRAETGILPVGSAPQGVAVTPDGGKAYVSNYLGRSVTVVSVADPAAASILKTVQVTAEPLPSSVINGKRLFFTSRGRMSTDNRIACISCHPHGGHDGRDWNFTRLGEGIRNTTDIHGIVDSGAVHWTANMDELQDLEFNIRNIQFGAGLIDGTPNDPFGPPNAGRSQDLDDFAAFMDSMMKPVRGNPNRAAGGGLTAAGSRGKAIFESPGTGCASCHRGSAFTDSDRQQVVRHDVGTLAPGDIAGADGFDTPSLLGLFDSPPYLHDGVAPALIDVLTTRNQGNRHGVTSNLTPAQRQELATYLLELDNDRDEMAAAPVTGLPGTVRVPLFARDVSGTRLNVTDAKAGNRAWGFDLALAFPPAGISGVSVRPAGVTAGLAIRSEVDPPADLAAGRKDYSVTFDEPIPFALNPLLPGDLIAFIDFAVDAGAGGTLAIDLLGAGSGLRNDTGAKVERPPDGNLLALGGSLTVGTPPVPDGSLGSRPVLVSRSGGMLGLTWGAIESGGLAVTYNIYRGGLSALLRTKTYEHSCFLTGLAETAATFADEPGDSYFLVSAVAPGFGEGSLGTDSAGRPRPNPQPCP
jgi:YVTN family beta-propeller protein